jgi:hypothetical protein
MGYVLAGLFGEAAEADLFEDAGLARGFVDGLVDDTVAARAQLVLNFKISDSILH